MPPEVMQLTKYRAVCWHVAAHALRRPNTLEILNLSERVCVVFVVVGIVRVGFLGLLLALPGLIQKIACV